MKIVHEYPPNIEKIRAVFTLTDNVVFTYGDTLFNPNRGEISQPLMRHEETHCKQQGDNPEAWWERYLGDAQWRVQQEIAAYRAQYKAAKKLYHDRERRHAYLSRLASDLSGPIYGNVIGFTAARTAIKHEKLF